MIAGILKSYPNFSLENILHDISFANLQLLIKVLQIDIESKNSTQSNFNSALDANNPDNFNDEPDEVIVRA